MPSHTPATSPPRAPSPPAPPFSEAIDPAAVNQPAGAATLTFSQGNEESYEPYLDDDHWTGFTVSGACSAGCGDAVTGSAGILVFAPDGSSATLNDYAGNPAGGTKTTASITVF